LIATIGILAGFRLWSPHGDIDPPVRLVVDISAGELYVVKNGETVDSYVVSAGTEENPTPTGEFTINKVIWNPAWVPPPNAEWAEGKTRKEPGDPDNPMKTAKIFFEEPDYYIHGTDQIEKLGDPASAGCIRMRPWHVAEVAKLVMETGGESRSQSWYNARIEGNETVEVTIPNPIKITIRE
jgi:lipoprotein-anchoring transpeptidase ErfK/SrfK